MSAIVFGPNHRRLVSRCSVFGELAALDYEPRSASVTAMTETFLLELDGAALRQLMAERQGVTREVIHILCQRIRAGLPKEN